jgi:hypothetical protein
MKRLRKQQQELALGKDTEGNTLLVVFILHEVKLQISKLT